MMNTEQTHFLVHLSFGELCTLMSGLFYHRTDAGHIEQVIVTDAIALGITADMVCAECMARIYHSGV